LRACAITGGHGFLAWHLRCRLKADQPETEVRLLGRGALDDPVTLAEQVEGCDAVFHLAAVNSHDPAAATTNVDLAHALVDGLDRLAEPTRVVYSNSAHAEGESPYGRSKRAASEVLRRWADRAGATVADVVLPNLFGENARPNYNSAVATFCDAVARGRTCEVNRSGRTELLHAQDAAAALLRQAHSTRSTTERIAGKVVGVGDVYDRITGFHDTYRATQTVPHLPTRLDLRLFNQLRVAMYPAAYPVALIRHSDQRGDFFEAARGNGETQTSFSTTRPGVTRGEHWHADKIERFMVLRGQATIEVRRLFDDEVVEFQVSGDSASFVDMPTLHAHNITNTGDDELLTMFWANDHFRPEAPDTWPEPVRRQPAATAFRA
jgi:UDP-2-acetamido-2,6-beta-L-arabino-hexul-4-ose reductase